MVSLAGSGQGFHGQRGRPWMAERGNLHLSVLLQPRRIISRVHVAFPLLAAVSVLQTLDDLDDFRPRAGVKWVNDILVEGAKVAGFITQIQTQEREVKAVVLGIGMNVGASPLVAGDPFVPRVASLDSFLPQGRTFSLSRILSGLLSQLSKNYQLILAGNTSLLLDFYRQRSLVLGRRIRVISDPVSGQFHEMISGRAVKIGENLELYLEKRKEPVTHGRLIFED
jgi:BirA family biotin operon repressor/biotin-[acetyl-CoA-carboxylase] ligase